MKTAKVKELRDEFAMAAMQSLILKIDIPQESLIWSESPIHTQIPKLAYQVADEMLKAREL